MCYWIENVVYVPIDLLKRVIDWLIGLICNRNVRCAFFIVTADTLSQPCL